jgi:eukaryotic-like serine/threonine-protein kinase
MIECPELGALESSPLPPELRDHVSTCESCRLVLEVFDAAGDLDVDDCVRFDALLAARSDGTLGRAGRNLLDRHLASCAACREVAETLSPTQDADGDQAQLPHVDPASYELGLEVARGGMGRIIAARDLRIGRPIAIKELLGRSPQLAARFEREARVTARLQHPGIVPIYEIGKWPDGTPFYTMRMVEGRALAEAIASAKMLSARLALLPAVIAATEAVAFAHAKRVIHRDLTPSNILVGAYGETVVIDWGLAKDLADDADTDELDEVIAPESSNERLTGVGAVIGTATYMPPEQAHAVPVDERADVYALGAILYHVLAGVPPYRAKTAKDLLRAVKTAAPPPIQEIQPGTPRDLVSIVTKAMARDPEARYPSARELAEELKRFQTGRLVEAHAYSRYELFKRFLVRHRAVVTVIALAVVISATLGTFAVRNILRSRADYRETVRALILEKGRAELLAGNTQRALAYLWDVHQAGDRSPTLDFLLGSAFRGLATSVYTRDCGSNGSVRTVAFDKASTLVAAACHEVTRVWRLADGKEVAKFETGDAGYDGVRFSLDGKLLATWGDSGIARVWNVGTGARVAELAHGTGEINRATFTPDASKLATTGADGIAIIWDVATGTRLHTITGSTWPFPELRALYGYLSPDGKRLFAMAPDGVGGGWDVETGKELGHVKHGSVAIGGDISPKGVLAASCGMDGRVRVWDTVHDGALVHQFEGHTEPVWKCVFSPDGRLLLTGGHDGRANVYDLITGTIVTTVEHGDIVINADFSPDTRRFATTGVSGRVRVWDTRTGALLANLDIAKGKDARFADNEHLVAARGDGRIQNFSLEPPQQLDDVGMGAVLGARGWQLAFPETVAETVVVRDLATQRPNTTVRGLTAPFAIARDTAVVAGKHGAAIRVVDLDADESLTNLAIDRAFHALSLSADGTRLVVMFLDADPEVWDVASGKLVAKLPGRRALLSASGRHALAWQRDQRPTAWDLDAKKSVTLSSTATFTPIGFARMENHVALKEGQGLVQQVTLWDTTTGERIVARDDTGTRTNLDPSGSWLTTIEADHRVTVWSAIDGTEHAAFLGEKLTQVQVNPQGTLVAGIAEYGAVALLMSAHDGRILARWPLVHDTPQISSVGGFKPPTNVWVDWTNDGGHVVSRAKNVALWQVANPRSTKQMADLVHRNVPWRVVDGQLSLITDGKLHGTVKRDGKPVPNVDIAVEIRTPPDIGAAPINWESSKKKARTINLQTTDAGTFSLTNLLPGEYAVTVGKQTITTYVSAEDEPIVINLP